MEFENEDPDDYIYDDCENDYLIDPDQWIEEEKGGMNYLNNQDYSLNSPLIIDELEELIKYINGIPHRMSWPMFDWERMRKLTSYLRLSVDKSWISSFHNKVSNLRSHDWKKSSDFSDLMEQSVNDANLTAPILETFGMKHHKNKNQCKFAYHEPKEQTVLKYGSGFLECHNLVNLMNAKTTDEEDKVKNHLQVDEQFRYEGAIKIKTHVFGHVYLIGKFLLIPELNLLIDRNHLLMIKDNFAARFQTLWYLNTHSQSRLSKQLYLYQLIDQMMIISGNLTFKLISLLESICVFNLRKLSDQLHPLIVLNDSFLQYITDELSGLKKELRIETFDLFKFIGSYGDLDSLLDAFGSFRHWGHPQIDYLKGLEKLHNQVNMDKSIDVEYANALASDLAFMVLQKKFKTDKKWYVDKSKLEENHFLYQHIDMNTWPTGDQIEQFGDHWNELPLIKCFEIPDVIDPSIIYTDKSHSMNKSKVAAWIKRHGHTGRKIPSKRVLTTFLETTHTNWPAFLREIDLKGLPEDDLIIGLKAKEREVKIFGRFFALMSWKLREYFVVTEYLIKEHFVPLFKGLTMADDLTRVIKKMLENSQGQGSLGYSNICISNHIDYEKWNNHQRYEATEPTFTVMGKFLGYPNLIARTHQFFEQSLIYYNERPDLMVATGDKINNRYQSQRVCWNGQKGGLEGLRQKGWSIINLLVIQRERKIRNTRVKTLAQGDNQVVCMQYKVPKLSGDELRQSLINVVKNNSALMNQIANGTNKLGLIINQSETLSCSDLLMYGKVPVFRGIMKPLTIKRWSRVTCVTNDQIPTFASIMATCSTNALSIANFDHSPWDALIHYNLVGNFCRNLLELHNPAIRDSVKPLLDVLNNKQKLCYKVLSLYLDPSLGGLSGICPLRFFIRGFPDPVTEGLSFWKYIHDNTTDPWIKDICLAAGNPRITPLKLTELDVMLENPLSLNIPKNISVNAVIRKEVKENLLKNAHEIKNQPVRDSLCDYAVQLGPLHQFLMSIKPIFPRFISQFKSGTFIGLVDNTVSLFQNSSTIRSLYKKKFRGTLDKLISNSEKQSLEMLLRRHNEIPPSKSIWECSSKHADNLRERSWNNKIVGCTIPHPCELLEHVTVSGRSCKMCEKPKGSIGYCTVIIPKGLNHYTHYRGILPAYLGSKTSESTSLIQPWEREYQVPTIAKAANLRKAINWFVKPESNLSKSILRNLEALTGEDWSSTYSNIIRTGSALHRFSCSRQEAGGYYPISPSKSTWMMSTTDTFDNQCGQNYDFMYQSLLIYSQVVSGELHDGKPESITDHYHIKCSSCVREIEEPWLESPYAWDPISVTQIMDKWKPDGTLWSKERQGLRLIEGFWDDLTLEHKSYSVGRLQGFIFSEVVNGGLPEMNENAIFPIAIIDKLDPAEHLRGLATGILLSASLVAITRRRLYMIPTGRHMLVSIGTYMLNELSKNASVLNYFRHQNYNKIFSTISYKIPPSYPVKPHDLGHIGYQYLHTLLKSLVYYRLGDYFEIVWSCSESNVTEIIGPLMIAMEVVVVILYNEKLTASHRESLKQYNRYVSMIRSEEVELDDLSFLFEDVRFTPREVRHALKETVEIEDSDLTYQFELELSVPINTIDLEREDFLEESKPDYPSCNRVLDPSISSLRFFQFATGAHYKMRSILVNMNIACRDFICFGDGSGGLTAMCLRLYPDSTGLFNSLLDMDGVNLKGAHPEPPSAIYHLGLNRNRCLNLFTCWQEPSDLTCENTWLFYQHTSRMKKMSIDLILMDMEPDSEIDAKTIERHTTKYIGSMLTVNGVLIVKTYYSRLLNTDFSLIKHFQSRFKSVFIVTTEITSSFSQEVYLVFLHYLGGRNSGRGWRYPTVDSLTKIVKCFKTPKEELQRSIWLKSKNLYQGIPQEMIPDELFELKMMYHSFGLSFNYVELLFNIHDKNYNSWAIATSALILTCLAFWDTTTWTYSDIGPPSDPQVINLLTLMASHRLWLSIQTNNLTLYKNTIKCINQPSSFYWSVDKEGDHYQRKWSRLPKYPRAKHFRLISQSAKLGSALRSFHKIFSSANDINNWKTVWKVCESINKKVKQLHIETFTGIFDIQTIFKKSGDPILEEINEIEHWET